MDANLGIVVIGRNEGARLQFCLDSLRKVQAPTVYVDSDSSDSSVALANEMGVSVLPLDPALPMTAARARREGFRKLLRTHPDLEFVFFVDGDCRVDSSWPNTATAFLCEHPEVGAVCGRRRELHPEVSVYNRLCDHEWDTPIGAALSVGGDAIYRTKAYREAGEFDPSVPAGEEPELCKRLRDCGWKIQRLDADMTIHDAAMTRLHQWWNRQFRTGYAGFDVERRFRLGIFDRIIRSSLAWGMVFPLVAVLGAGLWGWLASAGWAVAWLAALVAIVALQIIRIAVREMSRGRSWKPSLEFACFTMAAKVPIAWGVFRQRIETARGEQAGLVEYKSADRIQVSQGNALGKSR